MKKFLAFTVALTCFTFFSFGQKVNFGPKIGYSSSKISTNINDIKENAKNNFMAGVFLRIGKKVYVQPELMYHVRGGILDSAGAQQTIKFKNIDIPVMAGFKLLDMKVFNLRFMIGPVASFVLDKNVTFNDLVQDPLQVDDFNDLIWGLDVGLGVDVLFLTLDVRYEFGLNNIYTGPGDVDMKNNLWTVGLGFKIF